MAADLKKEFPEISGFSSRNVKYMRAFAEVWTDEQIVQRVVAQLPWGHNIELLSSNLKSHEEKLCYAHANIQNGWSRSVLAMQIDTLLHQRQGAIISNFSH